MTLHRQRQALEWYLKTMSNKKQIKYIKIEKHIFKKYDKMLQYIPDTFWPGKRSCEITAGE